MCGMSFFGWAMIFVGLGLVALAVFGLLALRLWRQVKALGRDLAQASSLASAVANQTIGHDLAEQR
jgi:hypothetical protein